MILTVPPFIFFPCTNKPALAMDSQLQVLYTRLFVFKEKGERVGIFPVYDCCHSYKAFIHLSKFCIFLLALVSFLVAMIWKKENDPDKSNLREKDFILIQGTACQWGGHSSKSWKGLMSLHPRPGRKSGGRMDASIRLTLCTLTVSFLTIRHEILTFPSLQSF